MAANQRLRRLRIVMVIAVGITASTVRSEPENRAKQWNAWPRETKLAYVQGLVDGSFGAYAGTIAYIYGPDEGKKKILSREHLIRRKEFVVDTIPEMLEPAITKFYENPKYAVIPLSDAALIVQKQLGGEDASADIAHILKVIAEVDDELNPPKP